MQDVAKQLQQLEEQLRETQRRMLELKRQWGAADVQDYTLRGTDGPVKLSEAFAGHEYLTLIHNMGRNCPWCTLWADGFNGVFQHIEGGMPGETRRAAFVVVSPDQPEAQREFAQSRGWKFRMLSHAGTTLSRDLGYADEQGTLWPGVSILRRDGAAIRRVARDFFGPGDKYNPVFSFLELMPGNSTPAGR